jgi:hypothetical protein
MNILNLFKQEEEKDPLLLRHKHWKNKAIELGRQLGQTSNLPKPQGDSLLHYLQQIHAGYRGLLLEYTKPLNPTSKRVSELQRESRTKEQRNLEQRHRDLTEAQRRHNAELNDLPEVKDGGRSQFWIYLLSIVIVLGESLVVRKAYAAIDSNSNWTQIIFFVVFVVMFAVTPHALTHYFKNATSERKRILIAAGVVVVVIAFFYVMSALRVDSMQNPDIDTVEAVNKSAIEYKPIYFIVISLFLLFLSFYLASLKRTREEQLTLDKQRTLKQKIEATGKELSNVERQLQSMPERLLQSEVSREESSSNIAFRKGQIEALFHESCAAFKESNLAWRTDQQMPDCFTTSLPNL